MDSATLAHARDGAALAPHLVLIKARLDQLDALYAVPRDPPVGQEWGWSELAQLAATDWHAPPD